MILRFGIALMWGLSPVCQGETPIPQIALSAALKRWHVMQVNYFSDRGVQYDSMTDSKTPLIPRAFDIAQTGKCLNVSDIAKLLASEGYDLAYQHLQSPTLNKQLRRAIRQRSAQVVT